MTDIDLDREFAKAMDKAVAESTWMPEEYMANDWQSDVLAFLRNGPAAFYPAQEALVNSWRERADKDKADCMVGGKFKSPTHRAAWNFADGLHTAAGELEAALGKTK